MLSDFPKKILMMVIGGICIITLLVMIMINFGQNSTIKTLDESLKSSIILARDDFSRVEQGTYYVDRPKLQLNFENQVNQSLTFDKPSQYFYNYLLNDATIIDGKTNESKAADGTYGDGAISTTTGDCTDLTAYTAKSAKQAEFAKWDGTSNVPHLQVKLNDGSLIELRLLTKDEQRDLTDGKLEAKDYYGINSDGRFIKIKGVSAYLQNGDKHYTITSIIQNNNKI
jgi:hypothetical protein